MRPADVLERPAMLLKEPDEVLARHGAIIQPEKVVRRKRVRGEGRFARGKRDQTVFGDSALQVASLRSGGPSEVAVSGRGDDAAFGTRVAIRSGGCFFDRGTIVLRDPPPGLDLADLPGAPSGTLAYMRIGPPPSATMPSSRAAPRRVPFTHGVLDPAPSRGAWYTSSCGRTRKRRYRPGTSQPARHRGAADGKRQDSLGYRRDRTHRIERTVPGADARPPRSVVARDRRRLRRCRRALWRWRSALGAGDGRHVRERVSTHGSARGSLRPRLSSTRSITSAAGMRDEALEMSTADARLGLTATPPRTPAVRGPSHGAGGSDGVRARGRRSRGRVPRELRRRHPAPRAVARRAVGVLEPGCAVQRRPRGVSPPGADGGLGGLRTARRPERPRAGGHSRRGASARLLAFTDGQARGAAFPAASVTGRHGRWCSPPTTTAPTPIAREHLVMPLTCDIGRRERDEVLDAFPRGSIRALVSARVLNEGIDVPDADVAIIVGGALGEREHVQRVGRLLRPAEGKRALVYELVTRDTIEVQPGPTEATGPCSPTVRFSYSVQGHVVVPHFLGEQDHPWLRVLLEERDRFVGRPQRELDARLREPLPCASPPVKRKLAVQVLAATLRYRGSGPRPPEAGRGCGLRRSGTSRRRRATRPRLRGCRARRDPDRAPRTRCSPIFPGSDSSPRRSAAAPPASWRSARTWRSRRPSLFRVRRRDHRAGRERTRRGPPREAAGAHLYGVARRERRARSSARDLRAVRALPTHPGLRACARGAAAAARPGVGDFVREPTARSAGSDEHSRLESGAPIFPSAEPRRYDSRSRNDSRATSGASRRSGTSCASPSPWRPTGSLIFPDFRSAPRRCGAAVAARDRRLLDARVLGTEARPVPRSIDIQPDPVHRRGPQLRAGGPATVDQGRPFPPAPSTRVTSCGSSRLSVHRHSDGALPLGVTRGGGFIVA